MEAKKVTQWVHIEQLGGDQWVLPIWASLNAAIAAGKARPLTDRMKELGVHISTRLDFFPYIFSRLIEGKKLLLAEVAARPPGYESRPNNIAYALRIHNKAKYQFLIDFDSFLFEMNSLYELWCEFFKTLHAHAGINMPCKKADQSIRLLITKDSKSILWLDILDKGRNFFTHRGAPYVAIDITSEDNDILILRSNVIDLSTTNDFLRLSEVDAMIKGLFDAKAIVRNHLIGLWHE